MRNKFFRFVLWVFFVCLFSAPAQAKPSVREFDRNKDGKTDLRIFSEGDRFLRKEADDNFDGKMDRIEKALPRGSSGRAPKAYATQ